MKRDQGTPPLGGDEDGLEAIEDESLAIAVAQLMEEMRDLRDEVVHLRSKVRRLEHRAGRGIPHPTEVLAIDA